MSVTIDELRVADEPDAWRGAGFAVDQDGLSRVGTVRVRLTGVEAGRGLTGWSLRGLPVEWSGGDLDGIPTTASAAEMPAPGHHRNGVTHIDHVVLSSPDLARTVDVLREVGLEPRRERDGVLGGEPIRQVFYRLGKVILEVIGVPGATSEGPSRLWGVTYAVADIDATAAYLGAAVGPVKEAVQPGRRITTLRNREIGISVRTALISPHVKRRA
ncbi:VOC family protein [Nocardioides sp. BGMRC 2183]|nr:VOC family protein [Nocardioides sp. BGMRC 2183]